MCPNEQVTVIFGFVPILPPKVISHILLPISALNRQSLWWSQLASEFHENHSVRPSQLWSWKWKRLCSGAGWHRPCESLWKHCPRILLRGTAFAGEAICQMKSWPPDILKHSIICGLLGLLSGILVTLKFGLFYSIFGALTVSNVLKKKTKIHFFPDYKNNALFIVQKLEKIKNTRRKFYHQRDRF